MGAFGEHLGLPWDTLESAIMELFSGLLPGRVPRWIWGAFGGALEGILEGFLMFSRSILRAFLQHAIHAL